MEKIENSEVLKITINEIMEGKVCLSIRLRGDSNWLYYENIVMGDGQSITVDDGISSGDKIPVGVEHTKVPLEFGKYVQKYD